MPGPHAAVERKLAHAIAINVSYPCKRNAPQGPRARRRCGSAGFRCSTRRSISARPGEAHRALGVRERWI
jgi:hypothetical protein